MVQELIFEPRSCYQSVNKSLLLVKQFIERNDYHGYDPYDGLTSPFFNLPVINNIHTFRFLSQQLIKRFPVNLRPLLAIKKSLNPVTLGLCLQGYAAMPDHGDGINDKCEEMISRLEMLKSTGSGSCWGYNFPWAARYADVPAFQPTVVATGIIVNGLYRCYQKMNSTKAAEMIVSACSFVERDLKRFVDTDGTICFSYSPADNERVYNGSMKAARILAQGYSISKNERYRQLAEKAVKYVVKKQQQNGSWKYSESAAGKWIDNYHTGYILDCLHEYMQLTGDRTHDAAYIKGFQFYKESFITSDGQPSFYAGNIWPADCTAAAQSLLTLTRNNETELACKVAEWTTKHMQHPDGNFYYRKYRNYTNKTSYMRWSDAWMFAGLSELSSKLANSN